MSETTALAATGPPTIGLAGAADMDAVRALFRAYAMSVDAPACFATFEHELADLPGDCAAPLGGILLARGAADGLPLGVVAFRPLTPGIAEMRRLFVSPDARGLGIGRALVEAALRQAATCGHRTLRLSTLPAEMPVADALYRALGFRVIPPYEGAARDASCYEMPL